MYKIQIIANQKYYIFSFDSLKSFTEFCNNEPLDAHHASLWKRTNDRIAGRSDDWFGDASFKNNEKLENHVTYQNMSLVADAKALLQNRLKAKLNKIDVDIQKKRTLKFNSLGLGVFSFSRASMGLNRLSEMKNTTRLDKLITGLDIELGRNKVRTGVKDVFAYFVEKPMQKKSVNIFVECGGQSNVSGTAMVYNGVGVATVVEYLEKKGLAVQVIALLTTNYNNQNIVSEIPIKNFNKKLDVNLLMLLCADPAFFRHKGFKGFICMANSIKSNLVSDFGYIVNIKALINANPDYSKQTNIVFGSEYDMHTVEEKVLSIINGM